jgi:shikimate dehydrogenase
VSPPGEHPIGGTTRVVGVIGDPVSHTRSPAIFNAAFAAAGLDWVYVAFPARAGEGTHAVHAARTLGLAGLNVTMPHKADAAWACDELTPDASVLGSVNVVTVTDAGRLIGDSTDGAGFVRAVHDRGFEPAGRQALVLGAGGAGRSIALALAAEGAQVTIAARRLDAAESAAGLIAGRGLAAGAARLELVDPGAYALVVNATPLGMQGEDGPVDTGRLHPGQLVVDTVYHPAETPFLAAARERGATTSNGLGMLVHQAALAFTRWTGVEPPTPVMLAAAEAPIS